MGVTLFHQWSWYCAKWLSSKRHNCYLSRNLTKPTKWSVHPAKTQISLGGCPVCSKSSLSAWRSIGSLATHWAHSEDSVLRPHNSISNISGLRKSDCYFTMKHRQPCFWEDLDPCSDVCMLLDYCKIPKYPDTQNICCNHSKIWTMWLYHRVMSPNDADGMANSVDRAVSSGSTLFA